VSEKLVHSAIQNTSRYATFVQRYQNMISVDKKIQETHTLNPKKQTDKTEKLV
jgi:hypothetical protein